jgi:hypothetical protein
VNISNERLDCWLFESPVHRPFEKVVNITKITKFVKFFVVARGNVVPAESLEIERGDENDVLVAAVVDGDHCAVHESDVVLAEARLLTHFPRRRGKRAFAGFALPTQIVPKLGVSGPPEEATAKGHDEYACTRERARAIVSGVSEGVEVTPRHLCVQVVANDCFER